MKVAAPGQSAEATAEGAVDVLLPITMAQINSWDRNLIVDNVEYTIVAQGGLVLYTVTWGAQS